MALSDEINRMIESIIQASVWTSSQGDSPKVNFIKELRGLQNPDLESMIKDSSKSEPFGGNGTKSELLSSLSKEDAQGILGKAGIDAGSIPELLKMGTSGQGIVGKGLGFAGALGSVFPPIVITLLIASMIPKIIDELQRPGGIFDKRVKIDARNEAFSVLDRQTRQNTRIGDRQVIIQQFDGFRNYEGYASTSTGELINKNADRVLDIGLFDRAQGMSSR